MFDRRRFLSNIIWYSAIAGGCSPQIQRSPQKASTGVYWCPISHEHDRPGHPESQNRLNAIIQQLRINMDFDLNATACMRQAEHQELVLFHSAEYVNEIKHWNLNQSYYRKDRWSPYASSQAYGAAAGAVASTIDLLEDIYIGKIKRGITLTRPPGHHATTDTPMGYCIFNNIAIAVKKLQQLHPSIRVAIVDIDAHHGNGIQEAFYHDANIFYLSVHQNTWPFTGKIESTGDKAGLGTTLNLPLPPHASDLSYAEVFAQIISPSLNRFSPDIIVVANGLDTHWRDPQSFLSLSLTGHAELCLQLNALADKLCKGKIAYVLEGGYQIEALSHGIANTYNTLENRSSISDPFGTLPIPLVDIAPVLAKVKKLHRL